MKIKKKLVDDGAYHIQATATVPEVEHALDTALYNFANQMHVRPEADKPIKQLVEEQLEISDADEVVASSAINELVPFAIDKSGKVPAYPPVGQARTRLERGSQFEFEFTLVPKPEYELTSYEPVSIKLSSAPVDEHEVERRLAELSDQYAEFVEDEPRPVNEGDHILLALETKLDGEAVPALTTEAQTYTVGAGYMPPGFDEQLLGMEVGETKTFDFEGPNVLDPSGQDTVTYQATVTMEGTQSKVVSVIDDAWVEKHMPFHGDAARLRQLIADGVAQENAESYEAYKRDVAVNAWAPRFEGSIADEVYESTSRILMQNLRAQLAQQGIPYEDFVARQGGEQQMSMMMMLQTRESLVQGYVLDAVYRHEGLEVTEKDLLDAARTMSPQDPQGFKTYMEQHGRTFALRETAERMVANTWILENAEIEYID